MPRGPSERQAARWRDSSSCSRVTSSVQGPSRAGGKSGLNGRVADVGGVPSPRDWAFFLRGEGTPPTVKPHPPFDEKRLQLCLIRCRINQKRCRRLLTEGGADLRAARLEVGFSQSATVLFELLGRFVRSIALPEASNPRSPTIAAKCDARAPRHVPPGAPGPWRFQRRGRHGFRRQSSPGRRDCKRTRSPTSRRRCRRRAAGRDR